MPRGPHPAPPPRRPAHRAGAAPEHPPGRAAAAAPPQGADGGGGERGGGGAAGHPEATPVPGAAGTAGGGGAGGAAVPGPAAHRRRAAAPARRRAERGSEIQKKHREMSRTPLSLQHRSTNYRRTFAVAAGNNARIHSVGPHCCISEGEKAHPRRKGVILSKGNTQRSADRARTPQTDPPTAQNAKGQVRPQPGIGGLRRSPGHRSWDTPRLVAGRAAGDRR